MTFGHVETGNKTVRGGLLQATDEIIEDAMDHADPMILRGLLYLLTGDESLIDIELVSQGMGALQIANASDVTKVRAKAAGFMRAYRDAGAGEMPHGPPERLTRSLGLTAGEELAEEECEMWLEQAAFDPWARGLVWKRQAAPEQRARFTVGIIGTGLSGLNAAVHLKRAGIPFTAFEKNEEVGGTWFDNRYPGARVDSPSRTYTHLFGVEFPYPYAFCPQEENLRYMRWVADTFDLRNDIQFDTEVTSVIWDDDAQKWELTTRSASGQRSWRVNAVITCVGFLSRPNLPLIPGMETFKGVSCHTAQWPADLDVTHKRVAVVGSGASGYQTIPIIAKVAAHTYVYQRTPSWCSENPLYLKKLPTQMLWLEENMPFYVNFARFRLSWLWGPKYIRPILSIDPEFSDPHARSVLNKAAREARVSFIRRKLATRPDLIDMMIPIAPPMSSRGVVIDPHDSIYDALLRDDVTLVAKPIERICPSGLTVDGVEYPVDVIIYATGFKANDFLFPLKVQGRNGRAIEDLWAADGPRAYIGTMLPGFPNFFMAYGPNANNTGGLQQVDMVEAQIRFALQCIAGLITEQKTSVDVSEDGYRNFNRELDREERGMIYMDPRARNYYQNDFGRSSTNSPIDFRRMWQWLRDPSGPRSTVDANLKPYFEGDLIVT